ncbi:unnamed protein product [Gadus morhua 'NCC']
MPLVFGALRVFNPSPLLEPKSGAKTSRPELAFKHWNGSLVGCVPPPPTLVLAQLQQKVTQNTVLVGARHSNISATPRCLP